MPKQPLTRHASTHGSEANGALQSGARRRPWTRALAWLTLLAPAFYLSYGVANDWASMQVDVPSITFAWEAHIPFLPWTIIPYWSINVFYALSLFLAPSRHALDRHAARLLTAQAIAVMCFLVWPLHFSFGQPQAQGLPGFLFDALRSFDQPFNQAPSLHIALAVILWDWYRRCLADRVLALITLHIWTLLICVSVLTTYQHHFIDIPTGALLGLVCVWLWPIERVVSLPRAFRIARNRRAQYLTMAYGSAAGLCLAGGLWIGGIGLWLVWLAIALALVALNYIGLSERGFAMDRFGRMGWAASWLFAPYCLLARLNAWCWTRRLSASVEVMPGVRLGRQPTVAQWHAAGRPHLLSLCAELPTPSGVPAECVPMLDLVVPRATQIRRAALILRRLRLQETPVWVCCALGFSRSAATVLALLVSEGKDVRAARAQLRRARRRVVLGSAWSDAVSRIGTSMRTGSSGDGRT